MSKTKSKKRHYNDEDPPIISSKKARVHHIDISDHHEEETKKDHCVNLALMKSDYHLSPNRIRAQLKPECQEHHDLVNSIMNIERANSSECEKWYLIDGHQIIDVVFSLDSVISRMKTIKPIIPWLTLIVLSKTT